MGFGDGWVLHLPAGIRLHLQSEGRNRGGRGDSPLRRLSHWNKLQCDLFPDIQVQ